MAKKKKKKSVISNQYLRTLLAMGIIVCLVIALVLFGLNAYTKHGEAVAVPSVLGMQEAEAAAILKKSSLRYEIVDSVFLTNGIPGAITDQVPEQESNVKKNRTIYLTMQAKGVEMVTIPPLKDFSQRQAIATLNSLGFTNISIKEAPSAYRGLVIDVTYRGKSLGANAKVPKRDPISLTVGAGGEVLIDSLIDFIPEIEGYDNYQRNTEEPLVDDSFFE